MGDQFPSTSFIATMLLIDVLFLAIIGSSIFTFEPSALLIGFGLFGVSPVLAYLITDSNSDP
jgi:hypothetical protein